MGEVAARPKTSKSRSGCAACKKKRMKCDETSPACKNCLRRGVTCPGYARQLKWSTKYERLKPPTSKATTEKTSNGPQAQIPESRTNDCDNESLAKAASDCQEQQKAKEPTTVSFTTGSDTSSKSSDDMDLALEQAEQAASYDVLDLWDDEMLDVLVPHDLNQQLASWTIAYLSDGDEHAEVVMQHYFTSACRVMSCFDSPTNPYRTNIPQSLEISPHIFHCLMSMSAAHLSNYSEGMSTATLTYQTKAVNMLQEEVTRLAMQEGCSEGIVSSARYQILLGTIILGMTSAWHDPTKYALSHLQGARVLFRAWSAEQSLVDANGHAIVLDREQSFIVGSMAYWEALASFLTDQAMDAVDYLEPFCTIPEGQLVYPNSWTGVSTPIFIYLAQTGILLRQKRVLAKLSQIKRGCPMASEANSGLLEDARALHGKVLSYSLPSVDTMEDTGDPTTPLSHLCDVAKIYRFVTLLELYQAFPSLASEDNVDLQVSLNRDLVFDLATSALTMISDLPRESGTPTVLAMAYISAGSALQDSIAGTRPDDLAPSNLRDELRSVQHSRSAVHWWRENVRQQIMHANRRLGLVAVQRGAKLVQEVWNRSDIQAELVADLDSITPVHWMDVMIEQRLETLYG